jgi:hypothetical protein
MPAYLRETVSSFLNLPDSDVLSTLTIENAKQRFSLAPEAIEAWKAQLPLLRAGLHQLLEKFSDAAEWQILLEYPIPQVGKRIDAVLLAHNCIIVIETKTGTSPTSAQRQVEDYAIALACFHEASEGKMISPVVLSNGHTSITREATPYEKFIRPCCISNPAQFGQTLIKTCEETVNENASRIDPVLWDEARFKPIPPIIDAAVKLYAGMDVFEIGHAAAAREDLGNTTDTVLRIVENARTAREKAICFVTGVPGAGKTLVGLNAVHHTKLKDVGRFLSGNGPLVKIIREALIRDVIARRGSTRRSAENTLDTFIANVHRFADDYAKDEGREPTVNVIVFDEAQRAWDKEQNTRPSRSGRGVSRPAVSEPEMLLQIMDRRKDWAVIVALIGGGQEINRGEAGLAEWGRSLSNFPYWKIYAAPDVISGAIRANGFQLFETEDKWPSRIRPDQNLHLRVNNRSVRAQAISDWVDAVLAADASRAEKIIQVVSERPRITREITTTKQWLNARRLGLTRSGLVSSASAARLRADGLEPSYDFHRFYEWDHWFLDRHLCEETHCNHQYCNDVRASSKLEVHATQFEIQGLELDWVGLCWGEDLVFVDGQWRSQKFNNKKWKLIEAEKLAAASRARAEIRHRYRVNAYRVLMTRARQGMILYIPNPDVNDTSRSHSYLDNSYDFLVECGAVPL